MGCKAVAVVSMAAGGVGAMVVGCLEEEVRVVDSSAVADKKGVVNKVGWEGACLAGEMAVDGLELVEVSQVDVAVVPATEHAEVAARPEKEEQSESFHT